MAKDASNPYKAKQVDKDGLIHYTQSEHQIWSELYQNQCGLVKQHMVREYSEGLTLIDLPCDRVPQCKEVSEKLKNITGWEIEPVPSLIAYNRFFNMLANKKFPAASFIRNREDFEYVTEPDIFHEIFGHAPLLAHPQVAQFSQQIGELGCQLEPVYHSWLSRLYWFTIEFGLIKQSVSAEYDDRDTASSEPIISPIGAAIASSCAEVVYASTSTVPERRPFDLVEVLTTPILFGIEQPIYYVLESFDQLFEITQMDILGDIIQAKKLGMQKSEISGKSVTAYTG